MTAVLAVGEVARTAAGGLRAHGAQTATPAIRAAATTTARAAIPARRPKRLSLAGPRGGGGGGGGGGPAEPPVLGGHRGGGRSGRWSRSGRVCRRGGRIRRARGGGPKAESLGGRGNVVRIHGWVPFSTTAAPAGGRLRPNPMDRGNLQLGNTAQIEIPRGTAGPRGVNQT